MNRENPLVIAAFNRLNRILHRSDETRKLLLMQQVKPSVRKEMYNLPQYRKTINGYIEYLRKCDTFPANYRDDYLERNESKSRLGTMDPTRLSQNIKNQKKNLYEVRKNNNKYNVLHTHGSQDRVI